MSLLSTIRHVFIVIICLIGTIVVVAGATITVLVYCNAAPETAPVVPRDDPGTMLEGGAILVFEVYSGETARSVGQRLHNAGVIKTQYFWYLLCRYDTSFIKAGSYRIQLPISQIDLHSLLIKGQQILVKVTIPEGSTLKKTARIFSDAGICDEGDFLEAAANADTLTRYYIPGDTMEGFLYPDTYLFPAPFPVNKVIDTMADTFFRRLAVFPSAVMLTPDELYEKVILASIVEREYRVDEEAALMAGVFYNRLDIDMALQSCATVEYVITEIQGKPHPERLFDRDTLIPNPYNTYTNRGLPPGPISLPGAVALHAVFNPVSSDYLYFRLVDPAAGRHYFSKTFDEHIKASTLYVKR
jgi:UPF0755 protein